MNANRMARLLDAVAERDELRDVVARLRADLVAVVQALTGEGDERAAPAVRIGKVLEELKQLRAEAATSNGRHR